MRGRTVGPDHGGATATYPGLRIRQTHGVNGHVDMPPHIATAAEFARRGTPQLKGCKLFRFGNRSALAWRGYTWEPATNLKWPWGLFPSQVAKAIASLNEFIPMPEACSFV